MNFVEIETSVNPPTSPCKLKTFAPLEASLLVTIYSSVITLPSDNLKPVTPSPK